MFVVDSFGFPFERIPSFSESLEKWCWRRILCWWDSTYLNLSSQTSATAFQVHQLCDARSVFGLVIDGFLGPLEYLEWSLLLANFILKLI
jgi:hypothetical protein